MALLGKTIRLTGRTAKGKNRVREHGLEWVVLAETDRILFAPQDAGPWIFVAPVGKKQDDKSSRWVRLNNDKDFAVVVV
jgi:hypothetical protein